MLYRVAAMTGLRASELASLTPASFDLNADPPTVTVQAACSKHRREDVLPIHSDLAARLRRWLSERERAQDDQNAILSLNRSANTPCERLFPGTWATRAFKMICLDLDAAGIPYATDDGVADFHSLRHTFISNLARGGVHPKLAQQLARHSSITLTMDRYSHVGLLDMNAALESLPTITTSDANQCRATGTTDTTAIDSNLSCTKSCTQPAEITRLQPSSPFGLSVSNDAPETKKTTGNIAVSRGFGEYPREDSNLQPSAPEADATAHFPRGNRDYRNSVAPKVATTPTIPTP